MLISAFANENFPQLLVASAFLNSPSESAQDAKGKRQLIWI